MIREVAGDLLLSRAHVIVHGVSPGDDFHQGLALKLRETWPAMYKDFRHYCKTQSPDPGGLWAWMAADGRPIVSLFTQDAAPPHGGRPGRASLQHVAHSLKALHKLAEAEHWSSMALPRLATGAGALSWVQVRPLIDQHLAGLAATVFIYSTFHAGVAAAEGL